MLNVLDEKNLTDFQWLQTIQADGKLKCKVKLKTDQS